uniref:Uncharacterized protein n=1 Tax=Cyprinodon variegatus TaxID=28743 RepID=A0A3Q2DL11_CYPVA
MGCDKKPDWQSYIYTPSTPISSRNSAIKTKIPIKQVVKFGGNPQQTVLMLEYCNIVFVDDNRGQFIQLKNPPGSILRIARLEDTIYRDQPDEVDAWGMFYLPKEVKMQVLGVVKHTSCPSDELVLMTCEDKRLYAYDGEDLHMVALNLLLLEYGHIEYPSSESYYNGQAFEDMVKSCFLRIYCNSCGRSWFADGFCFLFISCFMQTEEDWAEVKKGPVGKDLDQKHEELVDSKKDKFLENLKSQK